MTNVTFSQIDKSACGLYSLAVVNSTGEVWHYFKITIEGEQLSNWEQPVGNHERMEICRYHGTYIEKRRRQGADAKTTIEMRTSGETQG